MTQTISRLYPARENADAATADLRRAGFGDDIIHVVAPTEPPDEQVVASFRRGGVVDSEAEAYGDAIKRGETLVSVQAPFGSAVKALLILQKHGPTDTGVAEPGHAEAPADPATPLSSAFGWRVLSHNPAPLSSLLNLPLLSRRGSPRKPDAELKDDPAPFSKSIGTPVLTEQPTILSSRVRWRVLWDNPAPLSTRLKLPILSKEQKSPRSRFGLPLLSGDPAPLSKLLGLKVLSNDPAPLSRMLGWRVMSDESRK